MTMTLENSGYNGKRKGDEKEAGEEQREAHLTAKVPLMSPRPDEDDAECYRTYLLSVVKSLPHTHTRVNLHVYAKSFLNHFEPQDQTV